MTSQSAARRVLTQVSGACPSCRERTNPERQTSHDGPSGNRYYFNDSASAVACAASWCSWSARPLDKPHSGVAPHAPPAWFPTNVARNSHVNLSNLEIASLRFCGFLDTL